jgi:hypothetical protein
MAQPTYGLGRLNLDKSQIRNAVDDRFKIWLKIVNLIKQLYPKADKNVESLIVKFSMMYIFL